jgi:hypothetical protein
MIVSKLIVMASSLALDKCCAVIDMYAKSGEKGVAERAEIFLENRGCL